eukprot:PhM_4_TR5293/c0_g1_i1/m.103595
MGSCYSTARLNQTSEFLNVSEFQEATEEPPTMSASEVSAVGGLTESTEAPTIPTLSTYGDSSGAGSVLTLPFDMNDLAVGPYEGSFQASGTVSELPPLPSPRGSRSAQIPKDLSSSVDSSSLERNSIVSEEMKHLMDAVTKWRPYRDPWLGWQVAMPPNWGAHRESLNADGSTVQTKMFSITSAMTVVYVKHNREPPGKSLETTFQHILRDIPNLPGLRHMLINEQQQSVAYVLCNTSEDESLQRWTYGRRCVIAHRGRAYVIDAASVNSGNEYDPEGAMVVCLFHSHY